VSACDPRELVLLAAAELDGAARRRIEAHVAECPRCAAELQALRQGLALAARLPAPEPSPEAIDRVRRAALGALARRRPARRPRIAILRRYALTAAAALVALVGWSLVQQWFAPDPVPPGHVAVADGRELTHNWDRWQNAVTDSAVLTEELGTLQQSDPWTLAEIRLAGSASQKAGDELQEIIEHVELIEHDAADGS